MKIDILRDASAFDSLGAEWNALVERGVSDVPFLRVEYQRPWWNTLGGGEWPQGELVLAAGRGDSDELRGVAPLFFTRNRDDRPALMFIGSIEISDYLDLIVAPDDLPDFVPALLEALDGPDAPAWEVLDLYNLPEPSPTRAALHAAARERGWASDETPLQYCPFIALPDDWETYLALLDKKQRHEIRRKIRRVESAPGGSSWYFVERADALRGAVDEFMAMMATDESKARFLTPAMRAQFHESARSLFDAGWLQLAFLEVGGRKVAGYMNFDYRGRIWVYNSAIHPDFPGLSAGWVLLSHLIRWAIEHERRAFDFMRGDESYKYKFGARNSKVVRIQVRKGG